MSFSYNSTKKMLLFRLLNSGHLNAVYDNFNPFNDTYQFVFPDVCRDDYPLKLFVKLHSNKIVFRNYHVQTPFHYRITLDDPHVTAKLRDYLTFTVNHFLSREAS